MKIIKPQDFHSIIKGRHILLDTNIFIDASINPTNFQILFNELKRERSIFVTLEIIKAEFIKGVQDEKRFKEKLRFVESIIETCLPITEKTCSDVINLTNLYKSDGKGVSMVDIFLGATLMSYPENLLLMTRNTNDFPTNIFNLSTYFNVVHRKGIFAYGLYEYKN